MCRGGIRRLGALPGLAALLVLGCGEVTVDSGTGSDATGSTSTGSGTGSGSSSTGSTGTTSAGCDPIELADVTAGIGGFVLDGEAEDDQSGRAVSGAGDVNGDGIPDIVIGAPRGDWNGESSGRTYVVFGGDFSCQGA